MNVRIYIIFIFLLLLTFTYSLVLYSKDFIFKNDTVTANIVKEIYQKNKEKVDRIYSSDDRYMIYLINHWLNKKNKIAYIWDNNIIHVFKRETKNKIKNYILSDLINNNQILWFISKSAINSDYILNENNLNLTIQGDHFGVLKVYINNLNILFEDKNHLFITGNITAATLKLYDYY